MRDLEKLLREDAARERQKVDPGEALWSRLPAATWQRYQEEAAARRRRFRWLRRLLVPAVALATVTAAIELAFHPRPPVVRMRPAAPLLLEPSVDQAPWMLDEPALERLSSELEKLPMAGELDEDPPLDVMLDHLSDAQLQALAQRLSRS